jgi:hypothetical protein
LKEELELTDSQRNQSKQSKQSSQLALKPTRSRLAFLFQEIMAPVMTSPFAQFAQLSNMQYLNVAVVDCRIRGIYKLLSRGDYCKASISIGDMWVNLMRAKEIDFDKKTYNTIYDAFARMKVEMAFRKYTDVHNRLRDLHYFIENLTRPAPTCDAISWMIDWMSDMDMLSEEGLWEIDSIDSY